MVSFGATGHGGTVHGIESGCRGIWHHRWCGLDLAAGWSANVCYTDTARGRRLLAGALRLDPPGCCRSTSHKAVLGRGWRARLRMNRWVSRSPEAGRFEAHDDVVGCPFQQHTRGHWGRDRQADGRDRRPRDRRRDGDIVHTYMLESESPFTTYAWREERGPAGASPVPSRCAHRLSRQTSSLLGVSP